ncbi:SMC-Scp complex subunit ScpB [Mycoplasma sp. HU2014]|uniref:SMC-Scp complex subunit ScpB n=1 Tax=Mycoplasma sp. HU2014 TaxID=1664275 RepID=UPI00067D7380|nr:SMC-Scp complex subunit ScpB [Mycoplasma sp. HU2014]KNG79395.1 segregation and condensation protein B [Mycoplasma sp. HU2014]
MNTNIKAIIEGLLFIYGDDGISLLEIQDVLDTIKPNDIKQAIIDLNKKYQDDETCALSIQVFGNHKYRMQTKPELHEHFAKLEKQENNRKLSQSTIEVLSIIAYKGPISKSQIDFLRNSDSAYQMYKLREKKIIKVAKKDENTRANLYTITDNFFKIFNLQGGIESLPTISDEEIDKLIEQQEIEQKQENQHLFDQVEDFDIEQ